MTSRLNRRSFLKRASLAASALSAAPGLACSGIVHAAGASDKLNYVVIGCGVRGKDHLEATSGENLVAIVDVDEKKLAAVQKRLAGKKRDANRVQTFTDYRRMFDKIAKGIDAVFVATPNHHHALPAMIAMQLGKGVYCEKPLCHDVGEARTLAAMAKRYRVATQMGNQGHCEEGYRRLCEYLWAGAIGKVTETHSWTDRSNGGKGPRPPAEPAPAGLHWDEWIGPAPYREYHKDLHPHEWHGWHDFGNGSLGNMGCHVLDGVFWALKLEHPLSVEAEEMFNGTDERWPTGTRIRWDFPARGDLPPLKAYWYDGRSGADDPGDGNTASQGTKGPRIFPPLLVELKKKYPGVRFDESGTLYVGEKGIFYSSTYGQAVHLVPKEKMKDLPQPPKSLPRPKSSFVDFIQACREGRTDTATGFEYASRLTEFGIVGNLAQLAGAGKKVEWDGPNMKVTNLPELNEWVKREYRKGWKLI
jgi:predicted dehydrogenase